MATPSHTGIQPIHGIQRPQLNIGAAHHTSSAPPPGITDTALRRTITP